MFAYEPHSFYFVHGLNPNQYYVSLLKRIPYCNTLEDYEQLPGIFLKISLNNHLYPAKLPNPGTRVGSIGYLLTLVNIWLLWRLADKQAKSDFDRNKGLD